MDFSKENEHVSSYLDSLCVPSLDVKVAELISSSYSKVLLLGGLGFIGKNFYEYIVSKDVFASVIVIDKSLPEISHVPKDRLPLYLNNPKSKFIQIDLCNEKQVRKVFIENPDIDLVVNMASETRLSLSEEDYHNRCFKLPVLSAKIAAEFKVKRFLQLSCCKVYKSASSGGKMKEDQRIEPWDIRYQYLSEAEKELKKIIGLDLVILRAAGVYGPYDFNGEMILRISSAVIYKMLGEKMKVMWDDGLKANTINVYDLCRGIFYALAHCQSGSIFNIVDEEDTDQKKVHDILKDIFKIKIECVGTVRSYFLRITLDQVIQMLNEKHLNKWFELLQKHDIMASPVNCVVYRENLTNNDLSVDGEAFRNKTGFKCLLPKLDSKYFLALVRDYIKWGFLPPVL